METIFIYIIVIVAVAGVINFLKGINVPDKKENKYIYNKKQYLLNRTENEFFKVLEEILGGRYYIFPQMVLSAILEHKIPGQNRQGALNKINRKSVDYVICNKQYLQPILAIELDGSSHSQDNRIKRDIEVEEIFKNADFPLIRFSTKDRLNRELVKKELGKFLNLG